MGGSWFYLRIGDTVQDLVFLFLMRRSRVYSRYSCVTAGMESFFLDLTEVVENVAGCGSIWNS